MLKHMDIIKKELIRVSDKLNANEINILAEYINLALREDLNLREDVDTLIVRNAYLSAMEEDAQNAALKFKKRVEELEKLLKWKTKSCT